MPAMARGAGSGARCGDGRLGHTSRCWRWRRPAHLSPFARGWCRRSSIRCRSDGPIENGCGWTNAVRLVSAGGVRASYDKIACETAVALALWLEHEVQPLAAELLGQRVAAVRSFGSYACRNIRGNPLWGHRRSEHATANAADIAGFTLADGRTVGVRSHWQSTGAEGRFLREAHARACRYFRAALGPGYNAAHRDHFHLDRGPFSRCR